MVIRKRRSASPLRLAARCLTLVALLVGCAAPPPAPTPTALLPPPTAVVTLPPAPATPPLTAPPIITPTAPASATPVASIATDPVELARRFNADLALDTIRELASERYNGRRAGTPGSDAAARTIADEFRRLGLEPAGDNGGYLQAFPLAFLDLASDPELTLLDASGAAQRRFVFRQEFREFVFDRAGPGDATAPVVYAGRGDAAGYAGLETEGAIVLAQPGPNGPDTGTVINQAYQHGAAGLLIVTDDESRLAIHPSYLGQRPPTLPVFLVGQAVVRALLAAGGQSGVGLGDRPFALHARVHMALRFQPVRQVTSYNVLGLWRGSDPELARRAVIIGGHYDHVGRDPDGRLFAGANDNASGVAVMLEIARLWREQGFQPKTSVLFAAWGAEEAGLIGSRYYVEHPVVPLDETLAMLQLDVVGQGTGSALAVSNESAQLAACVKAAAQRLGVPTVPESGGGSDHQSFNDAGVAAALIIWDGAIGVIHRASDTPEAIDPAKLAASGRVATLALMQLSSEGSRP